MRSGANRLWLRYLGLGNTAAYLFHYVVHPTPYLSTVGSMPRIIGSVILSMRDTWDWPIPYAIARTHCLVPRLQPGFVAHAHVTVEALRTPASPDERLEQPQQVLEPLTHQSD